MTADRHRRAQPSDLEARALAPFTPPPKRPWYRPELTRWRIGLALAVALAADTVQVLVGPMGWAASDEVIDLVAMVVTSVLLGFHVLLLPTFVLEFLPVTDMLPTWTACVIAVVVLRRRQARQMA